MTGRSPPGPAICAGFVCGWVLVRCFPFFCFYLFSGMILHFIAFMAIIWYCSCSPIGPLLIHYVFFSAINGIFLHSSWLLVSSAYHIFWHHCAAACAHFLQTRLLHRLLTQNDEGHNQEEKFLGVWVSGAACLAHWSANRGAPTKNKKQWSN